MKTFFLCIALFALSYSASAQTYEQNQIDSLLRVVDNPTVKDADRIYPLTSIVFMYRLLGDSANTVKFLDRARMLAVREKDSKYRMYVYNLELEGCYKAKPKKITEAYQLIDSIYIAISQTKDREAQAQGYRYIAVAKSRIDSKYDYDETYKAIAVVEELSDK